MDLKAIKRRFKAAKKPSETKGDSDHKCISYLIFVSSKRSFWQKLSPSIFHTYSTQKEHTREAAAGTGSWRYLIDKIRDSPITTVQTLNIQPGCTWLLFLWTHRAGILSAALWNYTVQVNKIKCLCPCLQLMVSFASSFTGLGRAPAWALSLMKLKRTFASAVSEDGFLKVISICCM